MTDEAVGAPVEAMEVRVRAADWARSPIGSARTWPQSLRTALAICLSSRFPMLVWWGPELTQFYNDAYLPLLGSKHPAALGQPAAECWAEAWGELGPLAAQVMSGGGATFSQDQRLLLRRHGYLEETYWTFSYSPVPDDDGGVGGVFIAVTDTTTRVIGERRLRALRDLGELSTASVGTVEDACRAAVAILAQHRLPVPFSVVYLRTDDGAGVQPVAWSGIVPGSAAPFGSRPGSEGDAAVRRVADGGPTEVIGGLRSAEPGWFQSPPVGDAVPDRAVVLPITVSGAAAPIGVLVCGVNAYRALDADYRGFFDLVAGHVSTAVADAQAYLAERRRAEALAELDRAKTDFFSNVSHEFRTPLTLIMGPVAELRSVPAIAADPRARQELEVVERNALRLGKLVNTLLDFSRIQAGRIQARFEPVDLAEVTEGLASVFRSAVTRAGLQFAVDCPSLGELVHIDRDMWEKVVLNLLSNALKFTFTGGITVRLRRTDGGAQLTVTDTGCGIPADELPRLFERFHRVSDARGRSGEGSGIGLAMVRELVGLHGGTVRADSTPGAGSTFTVTLPLGTAHLPADRVIPAGSGAPAASAAAEPFVVEALRWLPGPEEVSGAVPGTPATAVPQAPGDAAGRVLVADDNADMREYLQRLLAPRYAVRAVRDGCEALEAAVADPPDLVVSDVMMPGLDGLGLLAALRADARTARVPVLLVSARAGEEAAVEGLAAGADDYLVKPFSAQVLLARVRAHLDLGRARREAEERFTAMADLAPALIWVAQPGPRRVFVNRSWTEYTGRPVPAELDRGWEQGIHPEDRDRYASVVAAASAGRQGWEVEFRLRRGDGAYHWLLERAVPIGGGEGFAGYVGSCTDINARFRETERQTLLAEIGAALDRQTTVDDQLGALARLLVDNRLADLCTVRLVGGDGRLRFAGIAGSDASSEAALAGLDPGTGLGAEVLATGRPVLRTEPPAPAEGTADRPGPWQPLRIRSGMALPLTVRGRLLAVLGLARQGEAPPFNDDDRELAEEIAARAALAVDNAMLLAEERAAASRLVLLQQATADLSAATTPVDVGTAAARHVRELAGPDSEVGVYEIDSSHRTLVALRISGGSEDDQRLWGTLPLRLPLPVATAVTERRPVWTEDLGDVPADGPHLAGELADGVRAYGLAAAVALPLVVAGRVVGAIGIGWPRVQRFSPTDRAMLLAVAEQCAQALDRARLYRAERGIAETLQLSLLPARLPHLDRLALAAHYLPGAEGTQAGGDWYDVVDLGHGRIAIAVGDVVGQGPAAAAVMGQLRSALSAALLQGCGPAEALELLDRFAARLPGALASTAACLVVDGPAGTVRWARAGHPPALLVTTAGSRLLEEAGGAVLGALLGRAPYTEGAAEITPGATLLLYTDGLVERRGELLDDGLARVCTVAARHAAADPARLTGRLLAEVLADTDQPDDVAVIAARVLPGPLQQRLPARPSRLAGVRRAVAEWAAATGLPAEVTEDLQLGLGEALANAVEHAYAGPGTGAGNGHCAFRVAREADGSVRVEVRDSGVWRPPPADRGHRGRGLELISALAHDVEVSHLDGDGAGSGTTVRFRLPARSAGPGVPPQRRVHAVDGGSGPARLRVHEGPGGVRLEVVGELDLASAGPVRERLLDRLRALPTGSAATLDLRSTTYLASVGVGIVLQALAEARTHGVDVNLCTERGSAPARILDLAGLDGSSAGPRAVPSSA